MLFATLAVAFITALVVAQSGRPVIAGLYAFALLPLLLMPRAIEAFAHGWRTPIGIARRRQIERLIFVLITFNAIGSMCWHMVPIQYDRVLHFVASFASLAAASIIFLPMHPVPLRDRLKEILLAAVVILALSFLVEIMEFSTDDTFGTYTFYDVSQPIEVDFAEDLFFDVTGLVAASFYLHRNWNHWTRGLQPSNAAKTRKKT